MYVRIQVRRFSEEIGVRTYWILALFHMMQVAFEKFDFFFTNTYSYFNINLSIIIICCSVSG